MLYLVILFFQIDPLKYGFYETSDPYLWYQERNQSINSPSGDDYIYYFNKFQKLYSGENHFWNLDQFRPPFIYFPSYLITKIFGFSIANYLISNILWLGLIMFSILKVTEKYSNRYFGLFSLVIFSIFVHTHDHYINFYTTDLPVTAMVLFSLYFITLNKNLKNKNLNIYLGIILGVGMLTKYTYFIYLFIPITVLFMYNIKRYKAILMILLFAFILSGWFYIPNLNSIFLIQTQTSCFRLLIGEERYDNMKITFSHPSENELLELCNQPLTTRLKNYVGSIKHSFSRLDYYLFLIGGFFCVIYFLLKQKIKDNLLLWTLPPFFIFSLTNPLIQIRYILPSYYTLPIVISSSLYIFSKRTHIFSKLTKKKHHFKL